MERKTKMNSRLILSISPEGKLKVFLQGKGKEREKLLRAFGKHIENELLSMEYSISSALESGYENPNLNFNQ
jgi:hypothetical protein